MLWWTLQNLATAGLLAGLVWVLCRTTRIGPVARHALWLVVLLKLLTPPGVAWPWRLPDPVARLMPQEWPGTAAGDIAAGATAKRSLALPSFESIAPEAPLALPPEEDSADDGTDVPSDIQPVAPRAAPGPVATGVPAAAPASAPAPPHGFSAAAWLSEALRWAGRAWVAGGICFALVHLARIARMLRIRRCAMPPEAEQPRRIAALVGDLSEKLGLRRVRARVVAGIGSPLVWCLVRPEMLWPSSLPETAEASVRGLIVHELAHLKRGDHWVGWLELIAGCVWWWNPLFWYVRHQLRENAELACDAWVVQTLPGTRRAYAEGLLAVCERLSGIQSDDSNPTSEHVSRPAVPIPVLGVGTGGRRILERRLAMILRDRVPLRLPPVGLLMIGLLMLAVLPLWPRQTSAQPAAPGSVMSARESIIALHAPPTADSVQLPPDAMEAIRNFERQEVEARKEFERKLSEQREALIRQLKELQDRYTRAGQLDEAVAVRNRVRQLQGESAYGGGEPIPDPGNALQFRGRDHQTFRIQVTGSTEGPIWGDGPYTDDSSIATAAVHAGILQPGQRGVVRIQILPGQDHYDAATRNGVSSSAYDAWPGSFSIKPDRIARHGPLHGYGVAPSIMPDPGTLTAFRGHDGMSFTFTVTGSTSGTIWGTGVYSDDSPLAVAAVHAGVLAPGETNPVRVTILPGRNHYQGSTQNGVTSQDWNTFGGSYRVSGVERPYPGLFPIAPSDGAPRSSYVPAPPAAGSDASPDVPGALNLQSLRDQAAAALREGRGRHLTIRARIKGTTDGIVWGTDTYTDDSSVAAAAVHAGVLADGETGWVRITLLPGQDHYVGSSRNGVASTDYGPWGGSFRIERGGLPAGVGGAAPVPDLNAR